MLKTGRRKAGVQAMGAFVIVRVWHGEQTKKERQERWKERKGQTRVCIKVASARENEEKYNDPR